MTEKASAVSEDLRSLAAASFAQIESTLKTLSPQQCAGLLIECCRVLDYWHVQVAFAAKPFTTIAYPDFDLIIRGWNLAVSLLVPRFEEMRGIPFQPSTQDTINRTETLLHNLGRVALLRKTADMIEHGMMEGRSDGDAVILRMSERVAIDHFLDQMDNDELDAARRRIPGGDAIDSILERSLAPDIDERMNRLLFPWDTGRGLMTGYDAEPEVDAHFLGLVSRRAFDLRAEAGIHPDASLGKISGADLVSVGFMLMSFYLKHIRFVILAKKKYPGINFWMSLTIWKKPEELFESIAEFTGIELNKVQAALDLFTLKREQLEYYAAEAAPFIPMLIKISDGYLLSPVSSIFRNPFSGVRTTLELQSTKIETSIRHPRESWMSDELIHLFLGNRYYRMEKPTKLSRNGATVTDVDAAVLDRITGQIALFQLKWQDFSTHSLKKQKSKARNFVDQVDDWSGKIISWVDEFGVEALCRAIQVPRADRAKVTAVRLFAIGRLASRFQSYGYSQKHLETATGTWAQFVRLREAIGPAPDVFSELHQKLIDERQRSVERKPMRHEIQLMGRTVVFEDLWSQFGDDNED